MDEQAVDAALRAYDDALFLTKEVDRRYSRFVYQVQIWRGDQPPVLLVEWRDPAGCPLPLSHSFIDEVKKLRPRSGTPGRSAAEAQARNDALVEQAAAEERADYEEVAGDLLPRISEKRSALLPRSPGLVASRRRARARGEIA